MSLMEVFNLKSDLIPKIATGFSGGIGRGGSVCGALVSAVMVIGMRYGRSQGQDQESFQKSLDLSRQVLDIFLDEYGSEKCQDIIGFRLDDPEQYQKWLDHGGRERCIELVKNVALFTAKIANEGK